MNEIFIDAIGLAAPGLNSWRDSTPLLRGDQPYSAIPLTAFTPTLLPANEQRRATVTVRLAFRVAEEIIQQSNDSTSDFATVFASSDADMMVSHRLCEALAKPQRLVSPTDFHNSVHNAPSGYWHIGAHSRLPSSAVAGHDYSFAVGLLETLTQTQFEQRATLLVCYDAPAPPPLLERRPLQHPFAVALLLSPTRSERSLASLSIATLNSSQPESRSKESLEELRLSNPAARSLPLLQAIASHTTTEIHIQRSEERLLSLNVRAI